MHEHSETTQGPRRSARWFRPRSLRLDLTVLVALAGLPAIGLALAIAFNDRSDDIEAARSEVHHAAHTATESFQRMVRETHGLLLGLSALPAVRDGDGPACSAFLAKVLAHGNYANLAALHPDGTVFCSAHPLHGPVNSSDRAYFQRAMASREFSVGGIHLGRVSGRPSVGLALPLVDEDGKVWVVLYAGLPVDVLSQVFSNLELPPGTRAVVGDVQGTVLAAHPPEAAKWIGTNFGNTEVARLVRAREEGTVIAPGLDGEERVIGFDRIALGGPETGRLSVVVGVPLSTVVARANRRFAWTLVALVLTIVLALLIARWFATVRIGQRVDSLVAATARLSAGDLAARTGCAHDPDEVGRLAAAFDGMAASLERGAATRDGLEDELRQAHKLEAVGRLAGGVAHDFNNLLTAILSYGRFLREDLPPDDPRQEDVAEIVRAGERAAGLTKRLLAFGRRQPVQREVLELNPVVAGAERLLQRLLGGNVVLEVRPGADVPPVFADAGQLEQVIVNLITNARDALPRGGTVIVETGRAVLPARDGGERLHAVLAVRDDGVGMDGETRARIFEPFFTTKAPGKGTGLGLATVFGIVEGGGGRVDVETAPGMGTTVRVALPAADEADEAAERDREERASAPRRVLGGTVLVVDDDDAVRAPMRRILAGRGFRTLEARSAAEALSVARAEGRLDVLVTDVRMPGRSGVDLALDLLAERPGLVTLLVSGHAERSEVPDDLPLLEKPFTPEELADRVQRLLDARAT